MTLDEIYAAIPAVDCIPGCSDCCGVIPLPLAAERRAFGMTNFVGRHYGEWASERTHCPNIAIEGGCRIHARRPFMCRLFGTVTAEAAAGKPEARMVCPHGRTPKVPLTIARVQELTKAYFDLVAEERK